MYEFEMYNVNTGEMSIAFGYFLSDVRGKYPEGEWICTLTTYVD